jgi:hypothetical protein
MDRVARILDEEERRCHCARVDEDRQGRLREDTSRFYDFDR